MKYRSAQYIITEEVKKLIPIVIVEQMVKTIVDKAYDRNLTLDNYILTNRFNLFAVANKLVTGRELIKALKRNPKTVQQVLPIAWLTEEKGEDVVYIALQSELEFFPKLPKEVIELMETPPNITIEKLLAEVDAHG